jgi:hypothetical protein
MVDTNRAFERAMTLAALSGLKVALGPALLTTAHRRPESRNWVLGALAEMVLDKVGVFPSRRRLPLLIPHTLAGAWVAHESMREDGVEDPWAAPMGAVVAAGVATIAPMVRIAGSRVLGIPDPLLGVAEDYIALRLGSQAMQIPMEQLAETAKESVSELGERVRPALELVGRP